MLPMPFLLPLLLLDKILGTGFLARLFTSLGFPNGYEVFCMVTIGLCAVFIGTVILKVKVFRD